MKKLITILAVVLITTSAFAQAPQLMSYQAVIRNSGGMLITSTTVGMQISILQGSASGTAVYVETQTPMTNANGLVSLQVGNGTVVSGSIAGIDWGNGAYYIKTETDPLGGTAYTITGTNQLLSVPYALYSENAGYSVLDHDTSATNELQNLTINQGTVSISNGNSIQLPDSSATNELQNLNINQGTISISNGNSIQLPDSSATNEFQNLNINQGTISISNGNSIQLPDSSATNEIQTLSISNDSISISQGNTIYINSTKSLKFPEGENGTPLTIFDFSSPISYTVPAGKNLYLTNHWCTGQYVLTNGYAVYPAGTTLSLTYHHLLSGILVNQIAGVQIVVTQVSATTTYTVPTGKTFYLKSYENLTYNGVETYRADIPGTGGMYTGNTNEITEVVIFPAGTVLYSVSANLTEITGYLK